MVNSPKYKIVMILVDGFGIPPEGWGKSIYAEYCHKDFINFFSTFSSPVDACLGIKGIPQSATGQSSILTGINTAEIMEAHIQAFPGPSIRKIIHRQNIFKTLIGRGKSVVFANAYVRFSLKELERKRLRSVTTVMTACTLKKVKTIDDLNSGDALYHDLTRETICDDFAVKMISPESAAADLVKISKNYDFTLFEYFQTDRAGHRKDPEYLKKILKEFSSFIMSLKNLIDRETVLIITSDHGNCEDVNSKGHNMNPVPLLIYGNSDKTENYNIKSIVEIYSLLDYLYA